MTRMIGPIAAALILALNPTAIAADKTIVARAFGDGAMPEALSDAEMAALRGGYRDFAFGVYLYGDTSRLDPSAVDLPPGTEIDFTTPSEVQISMGLGNFDGANGVIQLTDINGSLNVVNNTMVINVAVFDTMPDDVSSVLSSMFGMQ